MAEHYIKKVGRKGFIMSEYLNKIVYFDEGSVTDYVQIVAGGKLEKTTELLDLDNSGGNADIKTNASIGISSIFKSLIGFGVKAETNANLDISYKSESLVKTILQNTILTDFLDLAKDESFGIKKYNDVEIRVIKDSLSFIVMVAPYLKMFKDGALKLDSDLNLSVDMIKIDDSIKLAKGYFEFEGISDQGSVILRFNIDSFRNNYKVADLLKMRLSIYAVPVGKVERKNLSITAELNMTSSSDGENKYDNPEYGADVENDKEEDCLMVYDVLLAGV